MRSDNTADNIIETLILRGIEDFSRFYGQYNATVVSNADPEKRGRIRIQVPIMGHDKPLQTWVKPSLSYVSKDRGLFIVPEVGDTVRVNFERGDSGVPNFYISGFLGKEYLPKEFEYDADGTPNRKGFISRLGHTILIDDTPDSPKVKIGCHFPTETDPALTDKSINSDRTTGDFATISMDKDTFLIENQSGTKIVMDIKNKLLQIIDEHTNQITMDANGIVVIDKNNQKVEMKQSKITIDGTDNVTVNAKTININADFAKLCKNALFSSVLGEQLLVWLNTHVHLTNVPGIQVFPPTVPATNAILSSSVKLGK